MFQAFKIWLLGPIVGTLLALSLVSCGGNSTTSTTRTFTGANQGYSTDDLYRFFAVAFGAAPGVTYMGQLIEAAEWGLSIREIVNIFTTKSQFTDTYPLSMSNVDFATKLVNNVVGASANDSAKQEAITDIVSALSLPNWTRGDVIYAVFNNLASKPESDTKWYGTAKKMANQVVYAKYYTETMKGDAVNLITLMAVLGQVDQNTSTTTALSVPITNATKSVSMQWALGQIIDAGEIDMSVYAPMAPGQNGHYDLLATGDLNGDSHEDLLIAPKVWDVFTPYVKLVVAFYNPKKKTFEADTALQERMPTMQWSQKAMIADFNGDGYKDIFVVGTGPDQGQPCGEASVLMLGSKDGLVDSSHHLPRVSGYTHQMAVADFNGDGKMDFVILNNQWVPWNDQDTRMSSCSYRKFPGTGKSFIVLSNATGWTAKDLEVDSEFGWIVKNNDNLSYSSAFATDFDGDGKQDLVISGGNFGSLAYKNVLLKGDGKGGLIYHSHVTAKPFEDATVSSGITAKDLDGDGMPEMILNFAKHPGVAAEAFQGSVYQVYKLEPLKKIWTDVSADYFPSTYNTADAELTFCNGIAWADINQDGLDDMVCSIMKEFPSNNPSQLNPRIWLKTPIDAKVNGRTFVPAFHANISVQYRLANMLPLSIEGKIYLVGISDQGHNSNLKIQLTR